MAAGDTAALTSLISATSGLAGVALGGALTYWREKHHEKTRAAADLSYLSILVGAHLDQLVDGCIEVAKDDGSDEYGGPSTPHGHYQPTAATPTFDPLQMDVNWKVLPKGLMQEVLDLPARLQRVRRQVNDAWDEDEEPEYWSGFWARQTAYAELGLSVLELAKRLRAAAGLPAQDYAGTADAPSQVLQDRLGAIAREKAERDAKIAALQASRAAPLPMVPGAT